MGYLLQKNSIEAGVNKLHLLIIEIVRFNCKLEELVGLARVWLESGSTAAYHWQRFVLPLQVVSHL